MGSSASLVVRSDRSDLSRVSDWLATWAAEHALPAKLSQMLDLCATELVTNVVEHGRAAALSHPISLSVHLEPHRLRLEIEDEGVPFDPTQAPSAQRMELEGTRVGGWGIALVRHFADELRYLRTEAGNRLTVVFRLR